MKQYAVVYKANRMPLAFYCTEDAAMKRLMYITDISAIGVFECDVVIHSVLKDHNSDVDHSLGLVCTINDSLLSIHLDTSTAFRYNQAIKDGVFKVCDVEYTIGKEIKRPKKEKDDDLNDFS